MLNLAVMVARKTFDLGIAIKYGRPSPSPTVCPPHPLLTCARWDRQVSRQPSTVAAAIICMVNLISPSSRVVAGALMRAQIHAQTAGWL